MDAERQVRFLYPPFFLLASLAYGLFLDPARSLDDFLPTNVSNWKEDIVPVLIGASVFVLVTGFFIGTISMLVRRLVSNFILLLLRVLRWMKVPLPWKWAEAMIKYRWIRDEAVLTDAALSGIEKHLRRSVAPSDALYAAATFDHGHLNKGIHDWITRRWNAFNISVNSMVALFLSLVIGQYLAMINLDARWLSLSAVVGLVLLFGAIVSWNDTMKMIEFLSGLPCKGKGVCDSKDD